MTKAKYFFPLAALLTFAACASSTTENVVAEDDYYADDFDIAPVSPAKPVARNVSEQETAAVPEVTKNETAFAETPRRSFVGQKIDVIQRELAQLREKLNKNTATFKALKEKSALESAKYYESIAYINARLQVGTTPGNPELKQKWNQAVAAIGDLESNVTAMARLSTQASTDSDMVVYLLNAIRSTFAISGALDEEHDALRRMEDETNQIAVLVDRLVGEINTQMARQQQYVGNERRNVDTLAMAIRNGQLFGVNLADPRMVPTAAATLPIVVDAAIPTFNPQGRRPLIRIPFDSKKVAYEQALYQAVKAALEKRPDVSFELVAVIPANEALGSYEAMRNAEAVMRSLTEMGMPAGRVGLSKMQSKEAKTTEVQIYVK